LLQMWKYSQKFEILKTKSIFSKFLGFLCFDIMSSRDINFLFQANVILAGATHVLCVHELQMVLFYFYLRL
jgi:hypothetical protein